MNEFTGLVEPGTPPPPLSNRMTGLQMKRSRILRSVLDYSILNAGFIVCKYRQQRHRHLPYIGPTHY